MDGFQKLLGTTTGKGNLVIRDYGKNAYTIFSRKTGKAYRFSRTTTYQYHGEYPEEFDALEKAMSEKTATSAQMKRQKLLKSLDLVAKSFGEIFETKEVDYDEPPYAALAPSLACGVCGEMTMATKMVKTHDHLALCIPCSEKK